MKKFIFINLITATRGILAISLLFFQPFSITFFIIYSLCGISDIADGFFARKLKIETKIGGYFDTICDFIFLLVLAYLIISSSKIFVWIYIWIGFIFLLKIFNVFYAKTNNKTIYLPHTILNKIAGCVIFVSIFFIKFIDVNIILILDCVFATISSIDEFIKIKNNVQYNNKNNCF